MTNSKLSVEKGFTIIELLVSVLIFAMLSYASILQFDAIYDSINKRNAEVQILHDLRYAQALTVEKGCRGIFTFASDSKSYTFGCDYVPFSAANPPVVDSTIFTRSLPTDVRASSDALVIYNSRGQVTDSNDALQTRYISLKIVIGGLENMFNLGTLRPTGFYTYSS